MEGVDFPSLGISVARNDREARELHVRTYAATPSHAGRPTTWRVTGLPDPAAVRVSCDGQEFTRWRADGEHTIEIELSIGEHVLRIFTGDPVSMGARQDEREAGGSGSGSGPRGAWVPSSGQVVPAGPATIAAVSRCRCC